MRALRAWKRIVDWWREALGVPPIEIALLKHVMWGPGSGLPASAPVAPDRGPDFLLVLGPDVLGRLWEVEEQSDFPWNVCIFEPTSVFPTLQDLFRQQQDLLASGEFQAAQNVARALEDTGVKVVMPFDATQRDIAVGLQISMGWAWFRYRPRGQNEGQQ